LQYSNTLGDMQGGDYFAEANLERLRGQPLTAEEVQMLLGPDEALVFFLAGANETYVFALTRGGGDWRTNSLVETNIAGKERSLAAALRCGRTDEIRLYG